MEDQIEKNNAINRYPGIQPFSEKYQNVFYGRDSDIEELEKMLRVNRLMVVFGKSGLGKSSLFNAGLIPKLNQQEHYHSFFIRFGSYNPEYPKVLKDIFVQKIQQELPEGQRVFFHELGLDYWDHTLWQWLQTLHWTRRNDTILIVLDQFEELFSYPDSEVEAFMDEFSEIINDRMPEAFRKALYDRIENDPDFADKFADEIELIDNESKTKVIMGIRSDRLSLLDRFSIYLPNILKNNYELSPLSRDQASQAITAPAENEDETIQFKSPAFTYDDDFLEVLLDFLSLNGTRPVETFLLQIICQHIEDWVTLNKEHDDPDVEVTNEHIEDLNSVVKEYYINVVKGLNIDSQKASFDQHDELLTRYFIEDNLIDKMHNNRISLDMALVKQNGMHDQLIQRLINVRVIRQEPNTVSGISYELSHDTLLDPILNSEITLGKLEENLNKYYRSNIDEKLQRFIENHFLTKERKLKRIAHSELEEAHKDTILKLAYSKIIRDFSLPNEPDSKYEVYPMFQGSVLKFRAELDDTKFSKEIKRRRKAVFTSIAAVLLTILAVFSTYQSIILKQEAERQTDLAQQEKARAEAEKRNAQKLSEDYREQKDLAERRGFELENQVGKLNLLRQRELSVSKREAILREKAIEEEKRKRDSVQRALNTVTEQFDEISLTVKNDLEKLDQLLTKNPTIALRFAQAIVEKNPQSRAAREMLYRILGNPTVQFYKYSISVPDEKVVSMSAVNDNEYFIVATENSQNPLRLFDYRNGRETKLNQKELVTVLDSERVTHVKMLPNKDGFITATSGQRLIVWSLQGNKKEIKAQIGGKINGLDYQPLPNRVLASVEDNPNKVTLWYLSTGATLRETEKVNKDRQITGVSSGHIDDFFITRNSSNQLVGWQDKRGLSSRAKALYTGCSVGLSDFEISLDDQYIIGNCEIDNTVAVVWNRNIPEQPFRRFKGPGIAQGSMVKFGYGVNASPESIMVGLSNGELRRYGFDSENEPDVTYIGHLSQIIGLENSRKGDYLISLSANNNIKIWPTYLSRDRERLIFNYKRGTDYKEVRDLISQILSSGEIGQITEEDIKTYDLTSFSLE